MFVSKDGNVIVSRDAFCQVYGVPFEGRKQDPIMDMRKYKGYHIDFPNWSQSSLIVQNCDDLMAPIVSHLNAKSYTVLCSSNGHMNMAYYQPTGSYGDLIKWFKAPFLKFEKGTKFNYFESDDSYSFDVEGWELTTSWDGYIIIKGDEEFIERKIKELLDPFNMNFEPEFEEKYYCFHELMVGLHKHLYRWARSLVDQYLECDE